MAWSVDAGGGVESEPFMSVVMRHLNSASPSFSTWKDKESGRYHIKDSSVVLAKELILIIQRGSGS